MATIAQINDIVNSLLPAGTYTTVDVEPDFAKLVRTASVLIKSNGTVSYEDIRRTTPGEVHTIFLRIAAGRNADNNWLYTADDVIAMMTPDGSGSGTQDRYNMYGTALRWAAAKLVASHLLATIPLQSNLKFYDVAKDLKETAIEDIERIIKLLDNDVADPADDTTAEQGQLTLYIAHDLDLATIPEAAFNIPDPPDPGNPSGAPTYEGVVDLKNTVFTYQGVQIPAGQVGFCYFYMTGQAIDADKDAILTSTGVRNSSHVSYKIEDVFQINNGANIDEIITLLADEINSKSLSAMPLGLNVVGNILVGPERGLNRAEFQSAIKGELYPQTTFNKLRRASFDLAYRTNKLNFQVRRSSTKVTAELLTVMFYTVDSTTWASYTTLSGLRSNSTLGIPGLIYGQTENYSALASTSPFSVLLQVEKGNVIPVSIQDDGGDNTVSDDLASDGTLLPVDSFYFHADNSVTGFSKNLILRVSSTAYAAAAPALIEVDLMTPPISAQSGAGQGVDGNPPQGPWDPPNCIGEEVASRVVEAIYQYTRVTNNNDDDNDNTNILGVNLGEFNYQFLNINKTAGEANEIDLRPDNANTPEVEYEMDYDAGRVQIVGFKYKDREYRIVVDIVQIPPELWVATGNYKNRRTMWVKGKPRSITIETKTLSSGGSTVAETISQQLNSVRASVSEAPASKSPLLQSVYDKRKLLRESLKGFPNRWQEKS